MLQTKTTTHVSQERRTHCFMRVMAKSDLTSQTNNAHCCSQRATHRNKQSITRWPLETVCDMSKEIIRFSVCCDFSTTFLTSSTSASMPQHKLFLARSGKLFLKPNLNKVCFAASFQEARPLRGEFLVGEVTCYWRDKGETGTILELTCTIVQE